MCYLYLSTSFWHRSGDIITLDVFAYSFAIYFPWRYTARTVEKIWLLIDLDKYFVASVSTIQFNCTCNGIVCLLIWCLDDHECIL